MSWTLETDVGTLTWDDGKFDGDVFPLHMVQALIRIRQPVPTYAQAPFTVASAEDEWSAACTARAALGDFLAGSSWDSEPEVPPEILGTDSGALA